MIDGEAKKAFVREAAEKRGPAGRKYGAKKAVRKHVRFPGCLSAEKVNPIQQARKSPDAGSEENVMLPSGRQTKR